MPNPTAMSLIREPLNLSVMDGRTYGQTPPLMRNSTYMKGGNVNSSRHRKYLESAKGETREEEKE